MAGRAKTRPGLLFVASLAIALLAACGSEGAEGGAAEAAVGSSTQSVNTTVTPQSPAVTLDAYVSTLRSVRTSSATASTGGLVIAVVGHDDGITQWLSLLAWDEAWLVMAEVPVDRAYDMSDRPIEAVDATGDGQIDFLVGFDAVQPIGVVLSEASGAWGLLTVADGDGQGVEHYLGGSPRVENDVLVSTTSDCQPTCADAPSVTQSWRYSNGRLALDGPVVG